MALLTFRTIFLSAGGGFKHSVVRCGALCIGLLFSFSALAQTGAISGRIIDATSLEPLPFANVFINNTTIGTVTDMTGNFTLKEVPAGTHEVVFSFVGYNTYQARYNVAENGNTTVNIRLTASQQVLDEVSVKEGRDKAWERQLRKFEKVFFGDDDYGRKCSITNAWVIDFKTEGQQLTASASAPVEIVNEAMGYKMSFHLKEFTTDGANYTIVGNTKYEELQTDDANKAVMWTANRQRAYSRSSRHLIKALIDNRVTEEGFRLYKDVNAAAPPRSKSFNLEVSKKNVLPFEPSSVVGPGNSVHELKVQLANRIEVHYLNEPTRNYFYDDVGHSVSWLETRGGFVRVTREGVILNPKELIVSGDLSLGRVSEMLPLDYKPGKAVVISSSKTFQAARFEEKAHLHANKPYYYAGDIIWFRAYLGYRDTGKTDSLSKVVYVDLINPKLEVIQSKVLRVDTIMHGEFILPPTLEAGLYSIRAYTNWMLNYSADHVANIPIPILDPYEKLVATPVPSASNSKLIEIQTDQSVYGKRQPVMLSVLLKDEEDQLIAADLSVSVIDAQQVAPVPWTNSIRDALSFEKEAIVRGGKFSYRPEQGISIFGQFLNERNKPMKEDLTVIQGNFDGLYHAETDVNGNFVLDDVNFFDSVAFAFQPKSKAGQRGHVVLGKKSPPPSTFRASSYKYSTEREQNRQYAAYTMPADAIMLKEVSVRSTRIEGNKLSMNLYGHAEKTFTGDVLMKKGATLGPVLQSLMPGFTLTMIQDHWFFIRDRSTFSTGYRLGSSSVGAQVTTGARVQTGPSSTEAHLEPMLIIDNSPFIVGTGETVGDRLQSISTANVERVEVNSVATSTTGALGAAGVVNVFMNKASLDENKKNFVYAGLNGYDIPMRFFGPNYADQAEDHSQNDWRSALYWNPSVTTSTKEGTSVKFFTSDLPGAYLVIVEGMTASGVPVRAEYRFEVAKE